MLGRGGGSTRLACLTPPPVSGRMCSSVVADGSLPGDAATDGWDLRGWDASTSRPGADGDERQGRARTRMDDTAALRPSLVLPVLSKIGPKSPVRVPKPNAPRGRAK